MYCVKIENMKRIFIAIFPPSEIQKELTFIQEELSYLPVRWVPEKDLHLTLAFLGNMGDMKTIEDLIEETVKSFPPFSVSLDRVTYGPPGETPPSLVWATGEGLKELAGQLEEELGKRTGYTGGSFLTHLTLGRVNKSKWRRMEERPQIDRELDISFEAKSIDIMESRLRPSGAEYKKIKSFLL